MPFEDPWPQDMSPIDFERRMYLKTRNPLHVWRAFETCCDLMKADRFGSNALPGWILDYFERLQDSLRDLFYEGYEGNVRQFPERLTEALGFKLTGQGVRSTAFSDMRHAIKNRTLASIVIRRKAERSGEALETIVDELADELSVSAKTIMNAWSEWKEFLLAEGWREASSAEHVTK